MAVQKLNLEPSGRSLEYFLSGSIAKDAFPLIYIHGTPGAYPVQQFLLSRCKEQNFKLISFSRAGYGKSTRNPGRKVVDIVDDIQALLDHLGATKCVMLGWSGGGPHVLACAARLDACIGVVSLAGTAPYDAKGLDWLAGQGQDNVDETLASLKGETELRKLVEPQRLELLEADAAGLVKELASILPEVDKKAMLENEGLGSSVVESFHVSLKHSADGWVDDDMAFISPWGFELNEIKKQVFLYHGNLDLMVPYTHGQWLAKNIPSEFLTEHLIEGEGHISIWIGYMDNMLKELASLRVGTLR